MAKAKGSPKTGGRKPGSINKLTASVKDMIVNALDSVGGIDYLKEQASANPTAFMQLVGKVIPLTLNGDRENPINITLQSDKDLINRYLEQKKL